MIFFSSNKNVTERQMLSAQMYKQFLSSLSHEMSGRKQMAVQENDSLEPQYRTQGSIAVLPETASTCTSSI